MKFIDEAVIHVAGGSGGVGCVSFRREKFVPKGGPDGGNGGRGGSVILQANRHLTTLLDFHYRRMYRAPRGEHGLGSRKTGRSAEDVFLDVPVGTLVRDQRTGDIIADLVREGGTAVVARGGRGGRGNAEFATATNQAPREFEQGEEGEERTLQLELKLLADIGLVGLPNAGKSTLISVVSAARPKVADYPFTTLVPNLGIVKIDSGESFVVADIPGLIEGASRGKGLGMQFLRHVERTKALVFLLDCSGDSPAADYAVLINELGSFNRSLVKKPRLVVLTKTDLLPPGEVAQHSRRRVGGSRVMTISAVSGQGIPELTQAMWDLVRKPPKSRAVRLRRTPSKARS